MAKKRAKHQPDIDEQLRDAIVASGLTRYAIAKQTGIGEPVIGRFVNKERDLRLQTAAKLARFLGLELAPIDRK